MSQSNILLIKIDELVVSKQNVRSVLNCDNDETDIETLAKSIEENGLINPITVRKIKNKKQYEIIAGQRRFNAIKKLNWKTISCILLSDISNEQAELISLTENIQRTNMTTKDKVRTYTKLYELHGKNIKKIKDIIGIKDDQTLKRFIKISVLDDDTLRLLDVKGDNKISLELANSLVPLKEKNLDIISILNLLKYFTNKERCSILKNDIQSIDDVKKQIQNKKSNDINVKYTSKDNPYILHPETKKKILIPREMSKKILDLTIQYYDNVSQNIIYIDE
jgi:ParB family transcriptional regulator, chromosome partitioning protein